jgi:hypothetical protein
MKNAGDMPLSPIRLHGVVLNKLSKWATLALLLNFTCGESKEQSSYASRTQLKVLFSSSKTKVKIVIRHNPNL